MLRITKLADYATLILTVLASHASGPVSSAVLARRTQLKPATVSKILKTLSHTGLVTSLRGGHGGYQLARSADTISLLEIIQAIDGPVAITQCLQPEHNQCQHAGQCPPRTYWQFIQTRVQRLLQSIRLSHLLDGSLPSAPPPRLLCLQANCTQDMLACTSSCLNYPG